MCVWSCWLCSCSRTCRCPSCISVWAWCSPPPAACPDRTEWLLSLQLDCFCLVTLGGSDASVPPQPTWRPPHILGAPTVGCSCRVPYILRTAGGGGGGEEEEEEEEEEEDDEEDTSEKGVQWSSSLGCCNTYWTNSQNVGSICIVVKLWVMTQCVLSHVWVMY